MNKVKINIDEKLLIELIHKHSVDVLVLGTPYVQKVVNVNHDGGLFGEISKVADCDFQTFVHYVNSLSDKSMAERNFYERDERIDVLFKNIRQETVFREVGKQSLKGSPHVYHHTIEKLSPLKLS